MIILVRSIAVWANEGRSLFSPFSAKLSFNREDTFARTLRRSCGQAPCTRGFTSGDPILKNALIQSPIGDLYAGIVWLKTLNRIERKLGAKVDKRLIFCWISPFVNLYCRVNSASDKSCWSKRLFFSTRLVRAWHTVGRKLTCWYKTFARSSANGWVNAYTNQPEYCEYGTLLRSVGRSQ